MKQTTRSLSDLIPGDKVLSVGPSRWHRSPLTVTSSLGYIEPGSPVRGVRCGTLAGGVEMVLYADQHVGDEIVYERG